jgi:hypothetical protein
MSAACSRNAQQREVAGVCKERLLLVKVLQAEQQLQQGTAAAVGQQASGKEAAAAGPLAESAPERLPDAAASWLAQRTQQTLLLAVAMRGLAAFLHKAEGLQQVVLAKAAAVL